MTKDFEHLKGFRKEDESILSSLFTRDRQYSWIKMMIKRNLDQLLGNGREAVVKGRGTTGKTETTTRPRCKDQNRSPRGAHSVSPWRFFRTGETNLCWALHRDPEELGEREPMDGRYQCAFLQRCDYQI